MRRRIVVMLGVALALGVTGSQGEWKMRVHRAGELDEFVLSEIDSLTFYDDTTMVPGMVTVPAGVFIMGDAVAYCVGWTSPVGSYPDAPEELGLSDIVTPENSIAPNILWLARPSSQATGAYVNHPPHQD